MEKLQTHLRLLRSQNNNLQEKCAKLQQERDIGQTSHGLQGDKTFVSRILTSIANLYGQVCVIFLSL